MTESTLLKGNSTPKQLGLNIMQHLQHELLAFNPKQAGIFADWSGWGVDSAPLCYFCLDGPIDLKFGM